MKYKAVLFDLDGVIVNDEPIHLIAFQEVLRSRARELSGDEYKMYFAGKTDADGFAGYLNAQQIELDIGTLMQEKAAIYQRLARESLRPYDGVVELVRSLSKEGIPLALVTSSLRSEAEVVLDSFAIKEFFSAIVTADDIDEGKPDPEGYLKGAELLDVDPGKCLVIEDSPSGVQAAQAAGMVCAAVLTTHTGMDLSEADFQLPRLSPGCLGDL